MWGSRGFVLSNLDFAWNHPRDGGNWNNALPNGHLDHQALRYAAGAFPQALRKVPTFFEELYGSEVVDEGLMVLEPTTSVYAAVPTGTVQCWAGRITTELTSSFCRPAFCPERHIADGRQDLSRYRTLVVPIGPYMPEAVAQRLWQWVDSGGTLIALEPLATYDAFGRPRRLGSPFAGLEPGRSAPVGQGRVAVVPLRGTPDEIAASVRDQVDEATGRRAAWATDARLELMLRSLPDGRRVLVALNTDARQEITGTVHVEGCAGGLADVTVEGGVFVKVACVDGATEVPANMAPGEARVFVLEPPAP